MRDAKEQYDFGRNRGESPQYPYAPHGVDAGHHGFPGSSDRAAVERESRYSPGADQGGMYQGPPPPPAGYHGVFFMAVLYLVAAVVLIWTGACAAVTMEAVTEQDSDDMVIGLLMTAGSVAIMIALCTWILRTHRRRGFYKAVLDDHYAREFGHHPDQM